jgi:Flp pilus assembly pilin Flp
MPPSPRQRAQGLAEYGLVIALVSLFCIAALVVLGLAVGAALDTSANTAATHLQP